MSDTVVFSGTFHGMGMMGLEVEIFTSHIQPPNGGGDRGNMTQILIYWVYQGGIEPSISWQSDIGERDLRNATHFYAFFAVWMMLNWLKCSYVESMSLCRLFVKTFGGKTSSLSPWKAMGYDPNISRFERSSKFFNGHL